MQIQTSLFWLTVSRNGFRSLGVSLKQCLKRCRAKCYTYNALMDGYCLRREMNEAKKVFEIMVRNGCAPDVHSYNILINGYCKVEGWKRQNHSLLKCLIKHCLLILSVTYSTLMQGQLNEATRLFKEMASRDVMPNTVTSLFWLWTLQRRNGFRSSACL
uniref:Pentacotripeptide-repeat region of PRORP domain-containing protein n=1 Tax=Salix viminalis TaxID=40686 RepID=A0A6N2MZ60_SALVM